MKTRVPVNLWDALYYKTDPAVRQAFIITSSRRPALIINNYY